MTRSFLLTAAALGLGGLAYAGAPASFSAYDTNRDGSLSLAEYVTAKIADGKVSEEQAIEAFTKADTDASGTMSEAEYKAAHQTSDGRTKPDPATQKPPG